MALSLQDKKKIVEDLGVVIKESHSAVIADSRGVEACDLTELRSKSRDAGVYVRVVRNSLAIKAFANTDYECLSDQIKGPTMIALSKDHPGAGARIFREFALSQENFTVKSAAFEGKVVDVAVLSTLPTFEEAVAKIAFLLKEISAGKLCRLFAAIRDKKAESEENS